jgi:hypothetical protein
MGAIFGWWAGSAVVIIFLAVLVGRLTTLRWLGIAIDSRGRYSLSQLQLALWTVVILSLVAGIFFGRLQHGDDPLAFTIPAQVLGLLGISAGSSVTAIAAKVQKNTTHPATVAASAPVDPWTPKLIQIFLQEEGTYADQVVDITKFQNFIITIVLVVGYVVLAVNSIHAAGTAAKVTALPTFSGTFLILLGISHAAYLAGKIPSPAGQPAGLTVKSRRTLTSLASRAASLSRDPQTALKPGGLWQHAQSIVTWSDNHPVATVPVGKALAIVSPEQFLLHWKIGDQPWRDDTAAPAPGDAYAVVLGSGQLTGGDLEFTRRYCDQVKEGDSASGWEAGPNHIVHILQPAPPDQH